MSKRRVMLNFSSDIGAQALIIGFEEQFNLKISHTPAEIAEDMAWIELEFEGTDEDIDQALNWAVSRGVRTEELKSV